MEMTNLKSIIKNFRVSLSIQSLEYANTNISKYFLDITEIYFNSVFSMVLVPFFTKDTGYRDLILAFGEDEIESEFKARIFSINSVDITISSDNDLKDSVETFSIDCSVEVGEPWIRKIIIFYVSEDEFNEFNKDIDTLVNWDKYYEYPRDQDFNSLKDLSFMKFFLEKIMPSEYFSEKDFESINSSWK
jgi:hypothetical protein